MVASYGWVLRPFTRKSWSLNALASYSFVTWWLAWYQWYYKLEYNLYIPISIHSGCTIGSLHKQAHI